MKQKYPNPQILLNSYSEIFFLSGWRAGLALLLVTLLNPPVGVAGLCSVISAYLFSRLIGMQEQFMQSGFFTYNALLVGLSIGYLFDISGLTLFLVATAGILSFVLSVMLNSIFSYYLKLPILSMPFVIVSSIYWLASQGFGELYVDGIYVHQPVFTMTMPLWAEGFLTSLGAILFVPEPLSGLVIAMLIFLHSRILFFLAVTGYYLGALLSGMLTGGYLPVYTDTTYFNYILISMALGGVFLVPSPRSYLVSAIGVAISTILLSATQLFWSSYGLPVFTLPFNLVVLGFLYTMGTIGFPLVARTIRETPEDTLDEYISQTSRFGNPCCEVGLPFSGNWSVWQGFDGEWTHKGKWQHAYDFVITRNANTCATDGATLEDYYAWGKPVVSPCRGRVIRVVSNLPDNPPGCVNRQQNWGNLVIIESIEGWYVELSHFAQHSIEVIEGQWVEYGTVLGSCGNSGYSAQPHIHMQVQSSSHIGAPTLPFRLKSYICNNQFTPHGLPNVGEDIEPAHSDNGLEFLMAFPQDTRLVYKKQFAGQPATLLELTVRINDSGESYFDSGKGRLFFNHDEYSFYFYRLEGNDPDLAFMFTALPRMPFSFRHKMEWHDSPPLGAVLPGWKNRLLGFFKSLQPLISSSNYRAFWARPDLIQGILIRGNASQGELVEVLLDNKRGISEMRVGEQRMTLQEIQT